VLGAGSAHLLNTLTKSSSRPMQPHAGIVRRDTELGGELGNRRIFEVDAPHGTRLVVGE
jgi:hypothetical protein